MIRAYISAFIAGLLSVIGLLLYRSGKKDAEIDAKDDDYEHAEDIRRRVIVDRADRMRKLDDAGWRD